MEHNKLSTSQQQRQAFEAELTGELASIGIDERAAQAHIAQFWTGNGYNTHELQSRWLAHCRTCADQINTVATVAPLSRRLAAIAQGAQASNYERKEIRHAERLTGVHMPDHCRGCPHAGADACCGGAA